MNVTTALRRPRVLIVLTALFVLLAAAALWFKPWGLILNDTVIESAPVAVAVRTAPEVASEPDASPRATLQGLNRSGSFVPGEHDISGTARFIQTSQGVVLRLENLRTSNGPDVRVYLSTRTNGGVGPGDLQVGPIKANLGSHNYQVPAGSDVSKYDSVVIWCERFSVGFGHAVLEG
ncbi:MAG: DM13 domain-containing protein [Dermatophilaceae bacterium]